MPSPWAVRPGRGAAIGAHRPIDLPETVVSRAQLPEATHAVTKHEDAI
jgi:hypothetical protein